MTTRALTQSVLRPAAAKRKRNDDAGKQSTYIIEAMMLLLCVLLVVAVSMSTFAFSAGGGSESYYKSKAIAMASNRAEVFAATPWAATGIEKSQGCVSQCEVIQQSTVSGTMYTARITVTRDSEVLYSLETTRYVSDGGRARNGSEANATTSSVQEEKVEVS